MGTQVTSNYGWIYPNPFEEDDAWGAILNAVFVDIDADLKAVADSKGGLATTNTWTMSQTFSAATNTFGSNTGSNSILINGAAASNKILFFQTTGLNRWAVYSNLAAEAGSNVGSNFAIGRYSDAGAAIDTPFLISRDSGTTTLLGLALTNDLAIAHGGTGASDAATARTNLGLGTAATQNTGTSGATVPLLSNSNTFSTNQAFGNGSTAIDLTLNGATSTSKSVSFSTAGNARWQVVTTGAIESGSNNGSNFALRRYDDAGVLIDTPLTITRSTGVSLLKELTLTTPLAVTEGGTGGTTQATARSGLGLGSLATLSAVGTAQITDANVTTAKIADGNVTTAKIADANVTTAKIADANVTTAKIADASITPAKLNGAQSGSAPAFAARAWVNFNGTGTPGVLAGGNVSSITDNGVGDYTVNMTTAMADANYTVAAMASGSAGTYYLDCRGDTSTLTASAFRLNTHVQSGGVPQKSDPSNVYAVVMR